MNKVVYIIYIVLCILSLWRITFSYSTVAFMLSIVLGPSFADAKMCYIFCFIGCQWQPNEWLCSADKLLASKSKVNPLMGTGNYSATSNNMKLVHWPMMGGLLHLVQRGGDWAGPQPAQTTPRCTKCNSPPINGQCITITVLLHNGPLLCVFNVPIEGLTDLIN